LLTFNAEVSSGQKKHRFCKSSA